MTLLLPAAYAITRPGLVTSTYERVRLIVILGLKGLFAPLWVLFEAVADLIIAWLIASKVNKLAQDCHSAGQRAAQNNQERPLPETPDYWQLVSFLQKLDFHQYILTRIPYRDLRLMGE